MLHRHQEVSFQLQDLRTSTESVGFSCISSSPLKPHSEDPGSVPFSGKFCSSRQGFHAHRSSHNQHKPRIFLQISEALQFSLQTCTEQNTYFQGAKYNSLWRPFWSPYGQLCKAVSYTHLRAHETRHDLVCRLLLEKKK